MTLRLFAIATLLLQVGPVLAEQGEHNLELTILANEGLLIRSAGSGVLIDAFVEVDESERHANSAATIQDMLAGHPPFNSISLAIVSHPHREHFDVRTAGTFLKNHTETILTSTAEVIQTIRDEYPESAAIHDRLREIKPADDTTTSATFAGIRLDFMLLDHEASAFYPEQVLAHIIHLGGKKILYVGDSEMRAENWRAYDLRPESIDVLVLPLWLFKEESVRTIIDEHVAPKKVVVAQIPRAGRDSISELSATFPEVVFLSAPMASVKF
jgi:L-ascorbate metabolism protein UlaG (beta-lactamase superfamily)